MSYRHGNLSYKKHCNFQEVCLKDTSFTKMLPKRLPQVLYGSVLHLLVHYLLSGEPQQNLTTVWVQFLEFYKAYKIQERYWSLKLTMFTANNGFKLKGRAAEIRSFGRVLHPVWKKYMNKALVLHRKIELCLRLNIHMEDILDQGNTLFDGH